MQQTLLFQTSRTQICEIDFFTSLTKSCGEIALSGCDNDIDHTYSTHVFILINECSVSLYPAVIKIIIKSDIYSLFSLKI